MTSRRAGNGDARTSSKRRTQARIELKEQLYAVARTAKALGLKQFWLPRDKTDRTLIDMAEIFALRAQAVKQEFIEAYLPLDFIERLTDAARNLEQVIDDQVFEDAERMQATSAIDLARTEALDALRQLDPMMSNMLRANPATLAAWRGARHIERKPGVKRQTAIQPPPAPSKASGESNEAAVTA
jgi:hypothetical protein